MVLQVEKPGSVKVLAIREFCRQHGIRMDEEERLCQLFGEFASIAELQSNISRAPRWRY